MAISTAGPACARFPDRGGYTVHPVPTPFSTSDEPTSRNMDGGRSQKLMLFSRGKIMSGIPNIIG